MTSSYAVRLNINRKTSSIIMVAVNSFFLISTRETNKPKYVELAADVLENILSENSSFSVLCAVCCISCNVRLFLSFPSRTEGACCFCFRYCYCCCCCCCLLLLRLYRLRSGLGLVLLGHTSSQGTNSDILNTCISSFVFARVDASRSLHR